MAFIDGGPDGFGLDRDPREEDERDADDESMDSSYIDTNHVPEPRRTPYMTRLGRSDIEIEDDELGAL